MTRDRHDLVKVAVGELAQVRAWGDGLKVAGIDSCMAGDIMGGGPESELPDAVELWVHQTDAAAAVVAIDRTGYFPG